MPMGTDRYSIEVERPAGQADVYVLRDWRTGSEARIIPSVGNNFFSFRAGLGEGEPVEVMLTPPNADGLRQFPIGFGTPVLFPFPDLVRDATYTFEGKAYRLETHHPRGHASHAFVYNRPWHVTGTATANGATLVSAFRWEDHSDVHSQYPFPFVLTLAYTLAGSTVRLRAHLRNVGRERMPFGFGIHPYFRLPIAENGKREDCMVCIPTSSKWEVDEELLPTGRVGPAPAEKDYSCLRPLGTQALDDVYTKPKLGNGWSESVYVDPAAGVEVAMRADSGFREIVIYAPPDRPTICLEPYTHTTDAINLQAKGIDAGLQILEPAAEWTGEVEIAVRRR